MKHVINTQQDNILVEFEVKSRGKGKKKGLFGLIGLHNQSHIKARELYVTEYIT